MSVCNLHVHVYALHTISNDAVTVVVVAAADDDDDDEDDDGETVV